MINDEIRVATALAIRQASPEVDGRPDDDHALGVVLDDGFSVDLTF